MHNYLYLLNWLKVLARRLREGSGMTVIFGKVATAADFLDFGETLNPKYFPSMSRVCASMAGSEPKMTKVNGKSAHWRNIIAHAPAPAPLGGAISIKGISAAETKIPIIAAVMIQPKIMGAFWNIESSRTAPRATKKGRRPKMEINMAAVAHV